MMEISSNTLKILDKFSDINRNIVIRPGNTLMTVAEARNILAMATVPETFEVTAGIYDLKEFNNVQNIVDNPQYIFNENHVEIIGNGGRSCVKYFYSDPEMLTAPSKPITMPSCEVEFDLDAKTLKAIKNAADILKHGQLIIESGDTESIVLTVSDIDNRTSNTYSVEVPGDYAYQGFKFVLNIANLKMIREDYKVKISKQLVSEFFNPNLNVTYWVALEKSSSEYGE